jgi:cysteine desulfurase
MKSGNPPIVYLDNAATTELSNDVSSILMDITTNNIYGNPNSQHSYGNRTRALVEVARHGVADSLGCRSTEIVFTSGGTESNNLALRGVYNVYSNYGNDVVISAAEHSSVYNTAKIIVPEERLRIIPLCPDGSLDMEWADRLITEDTSLVSVMLANNETGAIFPIKQLAELAHNRGAVVHCDAVQAYGKIPIDVDDLGVDLLSISGHKVHALPGVGALYVKRDFKLHPLITGGAQEHSLRAGTENYVGITTLGMMANEISRNVDNFSSGLRDAFESGILRRIPGVIINAANARRLPNISSVTFPDIHAASMVEALAGVGVYASAGAACTSGSMKPSRTLKSMGLCDQDALSTVRFSFSSMSSMIDAALAIEACVKCAKALRGGALEE